MKPFIKYCIAFFILSAVLLPLTWHITESPLWLLFVLVVWQIVVYRVIDPGNRG